MCLLLITLDFEMLKIVTIFTSTFLYFIVNLPKSRHIMQNLGGKNQQNFYLFVTYYDSLLWVLRVKKKKKQKKANAFSVIFNIQVPILFDECSTALSVFSYKLYAAVKSTRVFCADVLFLDLDLDLGVIQKCKSLLCTLKMYVF